LKKELKTHLDGEHSETTVVSNLNTFNIDSARINTLVKVISQSLGIEDYELSISFVDRDQIAELNEQYRGLVKDTDVLSFPQVEWEQPLKVENFPTVNQSKNAAESAPPKILGDIVISLPNAEDNAENIGQELNREVCFLMVHGILHLCGHDHMVPKEEEMMLAEQEKLMRIIEDNEPPSLLWGNCVWGTNK
jgi:probable rRNA maturation factor